MYYSEEGPKSPNYFFEKLVNEYPLDLERIKLSEPTVEEVTTVIDKERNRLLNRLKEPVNNLQLASKILPETRNWINTLRSLIPDNLFIYNGDPTALLVSKRNGEFVVVCNAMQATDRVFQFLDTRFNEIGKFTKDFGLRYQHIISGAKFAREKLDSIQNISKINHRSPNSDFENIVIDTVKRITTYFISNAEIQFKSRESYEYDILVPFDAENMLDIEVMDYQNVEAEAHRDEDTLKSKVILSVGDKARLLNSKPIVILRGFSDETFSNLEEKGKSRGIVLLRESNYKETLEETIINGFIPPRSSIIQGILPYTWPLPFIRSVSDSVIESLKTS